jgi:Family of unknown function (DUF6496)
MRAIESSPKERYDDPTDRLCALGNPSDCVNTCSKEGPSMARYGKAASKSVESALRREKRGTLRSGKGGKGGKVASRKQAIAIGLSEARKKGAKVPRKKSSS